MARKRCATWIQTLEGDLGLLEDTIRDGDIGQAMGQLSGLGYALGKLQRCRKGARDKKWLKTFEGDLNYLRRTISEGDLNAASGQISGLRYSLKKMR